MVCFKNKNYRVNKRALNPYTHEKAHVILKLVVKNLFGNRKK
jgi:hypothetical protein